MSEYQYYEFLAIDEPLDGEAQADVRRLSTRADITATSFTIEYHFGDFRGDPNDLVEQYYDAHLYLANWGTRRVLLRLPVESLDLDVVEQYCVDDSVAAWTTDEHIVLDLSSDDEGADFDLEPHGLLGAIVGVRGELAAGDHRALYLAWLAAFGTWERDENAFEDEDEDLLEPPVPAGLGRLTAPQRALADFLRLDDNLIAVAAEASSPLSGPTDQARHLAGWIAGLPVTEKDDLLLRVATSNAIAVRGEILRRAAGESPTGVSDTPRRTVADLLDGAAAMREQSRGRRDAEPAV
jgi:hypothetical protein